MTAGALAALGLVFTVAPAMAAPAPTPTPNPRTFTATGAFSGVTVPDGVCSVQIVALGGAGGSAIAAANLNGAGARITASYPVVPGQTITGVVGSGGTHGANQAGGEGQGGTPGPGGKGGVTPGTGGFYHPGAGGGGYTTVSIGATEVIVAGGGGGSAGGHSLNGGLGGNAGLPTGAGVFAGANGQDGNDSGSNGIARGGQGGQVAAPGAGGVHSNPGLSARNGFAGVLRAGGNGGIDNQVDSGGGGGAGYFGAGGGASTQGNGMGTPVANGISGGGGGGGASYVAATAPSGAVAGVSSSTGPKAPNGEEDGANGSVSLTWTMCDYDLGVVKTVSGPDANGLATWQVVVTNNGTDDMTIGDTVTLTDTLPGPANTQISSITAPTGVSCGVAVGDAMTSPLTCSRTLDYSAAGGHIGPGGLAVGESITIVYTQTLSTVGSYSNTAAVTDRANPANNSSTVSASVVGPTTDDGATSGPQGEPQEWVPTPTPGTFAVDCAATLRLIDPVTSLPTLGPVAVAGEGTYSLSGCMIVFTPEASFVGTPATPMEYQVSDSQGNTATNDYTPTVTLLPTANDDSSEGPWNAGQSAAVLDNDAPGDPSVPLDPSSLTLLDEHGDPVSSVTVPEGVYTIDWTDPDEPLIVFTPNANYYGTPTPVDYRVEDANGGKASAEYQPFVYAPPIAAPVETTGLQGQVQTHAPDVSPRNVPLDPDSLKIWDPVGLVWTTSPVTLDPSEGTYSISGGELVFTPAPQFTGSATPIRYQMTDERAQTADSTYTPTITPVVPIAVDDASSGWWNESQSVDPLGNDQPGDASVPLDPATLTLLDSHGDPATSVTVPEGVYTIDWTDPDAPRIVFTPNSGYTGTPTPIDYRIADTNGTTAEATYRPVVRGPEKVKDLAQTHLCGTTVTFDLNDDVAGLDGGSVVLIDDHGNPVTELKVPGEGTWTVEPSTGVVTFVPDGCFDSDPTPVTWQGKLLDGTPVTGTLAIHYLDGSSLPGEPLVTTGGDQPIGLAGLGALLAAAGIGLVMRRRKQA